MKPLNSKKDIKDARGYAWALDLSARITVLEKTLDLLLNMPVHDGDKSGTMGELLGVQPKPTTPISLGPPPSPIYQGTPVQSANTLGGTTTTYSGNYSNITGSTSPYSGMTGGDTITGCSSNITIDWFRFPNGKPFPSALEDPRTVGEWRLDNNK